MAIYIGRLTGVRLEGDDKPRPVEPVALGVAEGYGLVTAETELEIAQGLIFAEPRRSKARPLGAVYYMRERARGSYWFHAVRRAFCKLYSEGPTGLPFAWLDSRASVACGREDFICG